MPIKCENSPCFICNIIDKKITSDDQETNICSNQIDQTEYQVTSLEFYEQIIKNSNSLDQLLEKVGKCLLMLKNRSFKKYKNKAELKEQKMEVFKIVVRTSQQKFPPENIVQLQAFKNTDNILVTRNRMSTVTHNKFYQNIELPIISRKDEK